MRMRRPGWLTVVTVLVGIVAVATITHQPDTRTSATATRSSVLSTAPGTTTPAPTTTGSRPPTTKGTPTCAATVHAMSLRDLLAQLLMVGVDPDTPAGALALAHDEHVGGLFIGSGDTRLLTDGAVARASAASAIPLFVSIDEEGGRVQRVTGPHGRLPSARTMAASMTTAQVRSLATSLGAELRKLGVNVDFAPDTDVSDQPADAVIGDRSFSNNPKVVTTYAGAFAAGLRTTGVLPVLKHFPGHGHAVGDSHTGAAVTPPLSSLESDDLVPYRTLPAVPGTAVMVGHLTVPGLTGTVPASLSAAAYRLLRTTYHFNGVAFTDDLGAMTAVTAHYNLPSAVLLAIQSGADVALWTTGSQVDRVLNTLTDAVADGALSVQRVDQAATRVLAAKGVCTS
ncbi:MAG TPA: glycoside hydrolase family 3 N-terminal domain-containing protein [Pseudonocardiaceae bacterium]|jgi:beta-N-acetylhexosaminidase|nr:glycoside hydrolase family 3 N-terminal domain-containing protein [Pseudonocardiaceae bacterium]